MKKNLLLLVPALLSLSIFSIEVDVHADTQAPSETTLITDTDTSTSTAVSETDVDIPAVSETDVDIPPVSETDVDIPPVSEIEVDNPPVSETDVDIPPVSETDVDIPPVSEIEVDIPPVSEIEVDIPSVSETDVDIPPVSETDVDIPPVSETDVDIPSVSETDVDIPSVSETPTTLPSVIETEPSTTEVITSDQPESEPNSYLSALAVLAEATGPSKLITSVNTDQKVVSLTISGVNNETNLDAILSNLNTLGVKATFFVDSGASQAMLDKIYSAGHEIGNQGYMHTDATQQTTAQLEASVTQMETYIQNSIGTTSKPYFRAPYGQTNTSVLTTVGEQGYDYTIGWTVDTTDYNGISSTQITNNVIENLLPGSIYLLHALPASVGTPAALVTIVNQARSSGYNFATISGLLAFEGVYTEPNTSPSKLINSVNTNQKVVSLTISGVNNEINLDAILSNLNTLGVKATFFVDSGASQTMLDKIYSAGHEIGNQGYVHTDATQQTTAQLEANVAQMETYIQNTIGTTSKPYFRAPYGQTNTSVLTTVGEQGYDYTIGWTVDTTDYNGISSTQITNNVIENLLPGSIYLLHALQASVGTPAALLTIVNQARSNGYNFATISGLLSFEGVYTEPNAGPSKLINSVNTNQKVISLTFDDGGDAQNLKEILDILKETGAKATFFVNGTTDEALMNRIVAEGHQLGNHTYSHYDSTTLTPAQLATDVNLMETYINNTTGTTSKPYFRAPYGELDDSVLNTLGSLGYAYTIGWTVDTWDWTGNSAAEITEWVTNDIAPGFIYLMHANETATETSTALRSIIAELKARGYQFATIKDLLTLEPSPATPSFVIPSLEPLAGVNNPVITINEVDDVSSPLGVADPFIMYDDGVYHLFFEVLTPYDYVNDVYTDKVAHAVSTDLVNWTYDQVVLSPEANGVRVAYPSVFNYAGDYYMVPDQVGNIDAYIATDFPTGWEYNSTLIEGVFVDSNVFEFNDVWYLTTSEAPTNSMSLYYNTSGDWRNSQWQLHPTGLIIEENEQERGYRGAGNPFVYDGYVVMPVQVTPNDTNIYGEYTYWYQLSNLSPTTVDVTNLGIAIEPPQDGSWSWTEIATHHISHAPYGDGYVYAVDGLANYDIGTGQPEYTIGLFTDAAARASL